MRLIEVQQLKEAGREMSVRLKSLALAMDNGRLGDLADHVATRSAEVVGMVEREWETVTTTARPSFIPKPSSRFLVHGMTGNRGVTPFIVQAIREHCGVAAHIDVVDTRPASQFRSGMRMLSRTMCSPHFGIRGEQFKPKARPDLAVWTRTDQEMPDNPAWINPAQFSLIWPACPICERILSTWEIAVELYRTEGRLM